MRVSLEAFDKDRDVYVRLAIRPKSESMVRQTLHTSRDSGAILELAVELVE